jgi:cation:H+ antiporter
MPDMTVWIALLGGLLCAGIGGELFVKGAVSLSIWMRVPAAVVGATVAAFSTSSPEISVAISAAMADESNIALGDALGSNIVNIALILGIALLMAPIRVSNERIRREFVAALAAPILTATLLIDGKLDVTDSAVLFLMFSAWMIFLMIEVRKIRLPGTAEVALSGWKILLTSIMGLVLLIAAGKLIIHGATGVAKIFGLSDFIVGATVVSFGTSVPELATVIISRMRGHDEVGIGTILGSNLFNNLFIVGLAASISAIEVSLSVVLPSIVLGVLSVVLIWPGKTSQIGRQRGILLLSVYISFLILTLSPL